MRIIKQTMPIKTDMLDTVILTIPREIFGKEQFRYLPEMFTPDARVLNTLSGSLIKCVNNPTAFDKKEGVYKPRLTLIKRPTKNGSKISLKIEFSVAKMLYGNNVEEVEESDFEKVVSALHLAMRGMSVFISPETLKSASVSTFHPSKNIELTGRYTSTFVIKELYKVNASQKMDLDKDSFRNNGSSLQLYTNSHSLVIYDKIKDLSKPEKRAIDKDQNSIQLSLFETLAKKERKELLRIEVRLTKKVKMRAVLRRLGFNEGPTFRDIFQKDVCQKILTNYWDELIAHENLFLFDMENNPKRVLEAVFKNDLNIKPKEAVFLVGLWVLCKEGIRDTRAIIEQHADIRTWYRIAEGLKVLDDVSGRVYHGWFRQIKDNLVTFDSYRLSTKEVDGPVKKSKVL